MQESELDNTGLADSQEWVDVPEDQVTEVAVAVTTVETPRGEEVTADQTVPVVDQPEVIGTTFVFLGSSLDCYGHRPLGTLTGPRTMKGNSHPSPGYRPNLEHLRRHPPRTRHKISQMRVQQRSHHHLQMVACQLMGKASRRLAGGVADNAGIVVSGAAEVVTVVVFAVVFAEGSEENVAVREVERGAVSDSIVNGSED